jgi:hypothetical protein
MPGFRSIESYKKYRPDLVLVCLKCGHEFVPHMEGRADNALTCSTECSKAYCQMSKLEKGKAKKKWRP